MKIKDSIKEYIKKINEYEIGFTNVTNVKDKVINTSNIPFRSNKTYDLSKYDTIISIVMPYLKTDKRLENLKKEEVYFSSSSWGLDYHIVLKEKLEELAKYIKKIVPNFEYEILVDNHSLDDRYIAYNAGLGFYGKNNLLINETYGSYIFIGNMLTNLHLESDKKINNQCLNCNKCINSCPSGALTNKNYNYSLCLSYLTQKNNLTNEEEKLLNNCIYGCDECMKICPYNNKNNKTKYFNPTEIEFIDVLKYQKLSNKEFISKYGHLTASWRGKKIIERNIDIYKDKLN